MGPEVPPCGPRVAMSHSSGNGTSARVADPPVPEWRKTACHPERHVPKLSPRRPRNRLQRGGMRAPAWRRTDPGEATEADSDEIVSGASGTFRHRYRQSGTFDLGVKPNEGREPAWIPSVAPSRGRRRPGFGRAGRFGRRPGRSVSTSSPWDSVVVVVNVVALLSRSSEGSPKDLAVRSRGFGRGGRFGRGDDSRQFPLGP